MSEVSLTPYPTFRYHLGLLPYAVVCVATGERFHLGQYGRIGGRGQKRNRREADVAVAIVGKHEQPWLGIKPRQAHKLASQPRANGRGWVEEFFGNAEVKIREPTQSQFVVGGSRRGGVVAVGVAAVEVDIVEAAQQIDRFDL